MINNIGKKPTMKCPLTIRKTDVIVKHIKPIDFEKPPKRQSSPIKM